MLRRFLVRNFKGFKDEFVFDLSTAKNYAFNTECVKDGIVNNAVIYGYNGCGKSNLGLAILDIVEHLTDNRNFEVKYIPYLNAAGKGTTAYFEYEFKFGESIVIYSYEKLNYKSIVCESLSIDGKEDAETIRSNCGNLVYILTSELSALEEISKLCGEVKSKKDDKSESHPLITVADLQKLQMNEVIVLRNRAHPFKTKFTAFS